MTAAISPNLFLALIIFYNALISFLCLVTSSEVITEENTSNNKPQLVIKDVKRIDDNKSVFEFDTSYADVPVVIQKAVASSSNNIDDDGTMLLTRDAFKEICGRNSLLYPPSTTGRKHAVVVNKQSLVGESWAGIDVADVESLQIKTIGDLMDLQDTPQGENLYFHDAPLSYYCPSLLFDKKVKVPKYFSRDYTTLIQEEYKPQPWDRSHPSIFVGKKGTGSSLHADMTLTHFWSRQLSGRKLWRLVSPHNYDALYPKDYGEYTPSVFRANIVQPDFERYPKLDGLVVFETILNPGDIMYVPAGYAHQVVNLDDTIMTAMNFVNNHNLDKHIKSKDHMMRQLNKKYEEADFQLLQSFFIPLDNPQLDDEEQDIDVVTFFKSQSLSSAAVPLSVKTFVEDQKRLYGNVDKWKSKKGFPALHEAAAFNFLSVIRYLLEEGGADVNLRGKYEATALDVALQSKNKDAQNLLLQYSGKSRRDLPQQSNDNEQKEKQSIVNDTEKERKLKEKQQLEEFGLLLILIILAFLAFLGRNVVNEFRKKMFINKKKKRGSSRVIRKVPTSKGNDKKYR